MEKTKKKTTSRPPVKRINITHRKQPKFEDKRPLSLMKDIEIIEPATEAPVFDRIREKKIKDSKPEKEVKKEPWIQRKKKNFLEKKKNLKILYTKFDLWLFALIIDIVNIQKDLNVSKWQTLFKKVLKIKRSYYKRLAKRKKRLKEMYANVDLKKRKKTLIEEEFEAYKEGVYQDWATKYLCTDREKFKKDMRFSISHKYNEFNEYRRIEKRVHKKIKKDTKGLKDLKIKIYLRDQFFIYLFVFFICLWKFSEFVKILKRVGRFISWFFSGKGFVGKLFKRLRGLNKEEYKDLSYSDARDREYKLRNYYTFTRQEKPLKEWIYRYTHWGNSMWDYNIFYVLPINRFSFWVLTPIVLVLMACAYLYFANWTSMDDNREQYINYYIPEVTHKAVATFGWKVWRMRKWISEVIFVALAKYWSVSITTIEFIYKFFTSQKTEDPYYATHRKRLLDYVDRYIVWEYGERSAERDNWWNTFLYDDWNDVWTKSSTWQEEEEIYLDPKSERRNTRTWY